MILFIGDGMGVSTVTAARIYGGQLKGKQGEESVLEFEKFPNVGLSKVGKGLILYPYKIFNFLLFKFMKNQNLF